MASTRLFGKVLKDVAGEPLLHHVVNRAARAKSLSDLVIATSLNKTDDPIEEFCSTRRVQCFRGSEDDVLDRYYRAAASVEARVIVRLTADCPLLDPSVIDEVVGFFNENCFDYASNVVECRYPDGLDTEVFDRETLERTWRSAALKSEREHVTPYMRNHPELFRIGSLKNEEDLSSLRWTVDEAKDLDFVRSVYRYLAPNDVRMNDVLSVLRQHPELQTMNEGISRNEGYAKSLKEDAIINQAEAT